MNPEERAIGPAARAPVPGVGPGPPHPFLAQAVLGGAHALRNALQVVRTYTLHLGLAAEPGQEAVRAGLERCLEIVEALEALAAPEPEPAPAPEAVARCLRALPALFVFPLRERGLELRVEVEPEAGPLLGRWEAYQCAAWATAELLDLVPAGMPGRLSLHARAEELLLAWEPGSGVLPFPLLGEPPAGPVRGIAARAGLEIEILAGGRGMRLAPAGRA